MRAEDDMHRFVAPATLLHDRLDRYAVFAEDAGDGRQDAGLVQGRHPEIVGAGQPAHRGDGRLADVLRQVRQRRHPVDRPGDDVPADVDDVGGDGAAGRHHAGAETVEQDVADGIAGELDGVEGAVDIGEHMVDRDHGRVDPGLDMVAVVAADGEELDPIAEFAGEVDVDRADAADPLDGDVIELDMQAVGDGHQDRQLVGGVDPLDVVGGIGLGKALGLGVFQHLGKGGAMIGHLGEDVVGSAVHDPLDRLDPVGDQAFFQRFDDRDAAADAGLEADFHPFGHRGVEDLPAMDGEQSLVGGDDMLAAGDRLEDEGPGRFDAADQFDDDIDGGVGEDVVGIPAEDDVAELSGERGDIDVGDPGKDDVGADLPAQPLLLFEQSLGKTAADGAEADKTYANVFHTILHARGEVC